MLKLFRVQSKCCLVKVVSKLSSSETLYKIMSSFETLFFGSRAAFPYTFYFLLFSNLQSVYYHYTVHAQNSNNIIFKRSKNSNVESRKRER